MEETFDSFQQDGQPNGELGPAEPRYQKEAFLFTPICLLLYNHFFRPRGIKLYYQNGCGAHGQISPPGSIGLHERPHSMQTPISNPQDFFWLRPWVYIFRDFTGSNSPNEFFTVKKPIRREIRPNSIENP